MNATATTAAKTEAKPEEKAINKMNRQELEAKKVELNNKLDDPASLGDYDVLSKQKKDILLALHKLDEMRDGDIQKVCADILKHEIKLAHLSPEARQMLGAVVVQAATSTGTKKRGVAPGTPRNVLKTGAVLFGIDSISGRGAGPTYNKGQELGATVSPSWKAMYEANKDNFQAALEAKFTEEGKAHFATEAGKAELAAFIDWVKTKPQTKPAKKK